MQQFNVFKLILISITALVTLLLVAAISSLLFIPSPASIWNNLGNPELIYALTLSLWTAGAATLLVMLAAIPVGYAMSRFRFAGRRLVKTVLDLPIAFPELVLGLCLLLFFGSDHVAAALKTVGIDLVFTRQGIIAAQFFTALPYTIRILQTTFDYVNPRHELVSRSLGYTHAETFLKVVLPMAKKGILAAAVIAFARSIGAFGAVLILAGGTYMKTEVLPIALFLNISFGNLDMAVTAGLLMLVVSFFAIYIFEKTEADL
mgnify:CR=1 FL=1